MPNWVINKISAPKSVLDALGRYLTDEEKAAAEAERQAAQQRINERHALQVATGQATGEPYQVPPNDFGWFVDFGLLVPEPENIEQGGCGNRQDDYIDKTGRLMHRGKDGEPDTVCWYKWSISAWGTKWNATRTRRVHDEMVTFETAWSHPYPVIAALSARFPWALIEVFYADEDLGQNVAHYSIINGVRAFADNDPDEGTDEALRLACALWDYDYEEIVADREAARLEDEKWEREQAGTQ